MNTEQGKDKLAPTATQRILGYLGELKQGDSATLMRMTADLDIPHNTLAMHIKTLESMRYVATQVANGDKLVRLDERLDPGVILQIVPEWDDEFGAHPYEGRTVRRALLK